MCYEMSGWLWKLRAKQLAQKERDAAKVADVQKQRVTPVARSVPETKVEKPERVSA